MVGAEPGGDTVEPVEILLIEPYLGGSHRAWAEGYATVSTHSVRIVGLPARWWKWRMRGGAVTLAERCAELAADGYRPDVLFVSSMVDLPTLRSFLHPVWGRLPAALYLHETQLTYPDSPQVRRPTRPGPGADLSYAVTNWLSALSAERVLFNSGYHLEVFFEELPRLLRGFPDFTHEHRIAEVSEKSEVLPVGVDLSWIDGSSHRSDPPLVLWNHRWEHDKDPELFFDALDRISEQHVAFRLAVCGENHREDPSEFRAARSRFGDQIVQFGFADVGTYRQLLKASDIVVSTARQEFFGVSVVEACAAGAFPVLPDRLSYRWLIPDRLHEQCLYPEGRLVPALLRAIAEPDERRTISSRLRPAMARFGWDRLRPAYDRILADLA